MSSFPAIRLKQVAVHNLKGVDLTLQPNELIVFTGISGSGKSSMAFDTLYMEGQRRYLESLSTYARRYVGQGKAPVIESAEGLSPTIAIEQKTLSKNPRSTVGTLTEIYDYMRLLYARVAIPHCPLSGEVVVEQSEEEVVALIQKRHANEKVMVLVPWAEERKGGFRADREKFLREGFVSAMIDGQLVSLQEEIALNEQVAHNIDLVIGRLKWTETNAGRSFEVLQTALAWGKGRVKIRCGEKETLYSLHAYSPLSGCSYAPLTPRDFSFNHPLGMCPACHGLGEKKDFCLDRLIDSQKSIAEDCCALASSYHTVRYGNIYRYLAQHYSFDLFAPWSTLSPSAQRIFLYGTEQEGWLKVPFVHPESGRRWMEPIKWKGVLHEIRRRYESASSEQYRKKREQWMSKQPCLECNGSRLRPYPAAAKFRNHRICEMTAMSIQRCFDFFSGLTLSSTEERIALEIVQEIRERLQFLLDVGLGYLTLNRTAPTLSGGEAQRVRLAAQVGCGLVGMTYILDEPSIGLHSRDNQKLISTLKQLRDRGNTVIVVEHDEETIRAADRIVDFGPGAGIRGGTILHNGSIASLLSCKESLTAAFLSGKKAIAKPLQPRPRGEKSLSLSGIEYHNLKKVTLSLPLGLLVGITGVSGSGKSSLVYVLNLFLSDYFSKKESTSSHYWSSAFGMEYLSKVIVVDQSPIGKTSRSTPATYIGLFQLIREWFTQCEESQARGYSASRFSFNLSEGQCPKCQGKGEIALERDFLEEAWEVCPTCQGKRFNAETLSIIFRGKTIAEILRMPVDEAVVFFAFHPAILLSLKLLQDVGLGYLTLGQSSKTLSGGEAQRIKLVRELVSPPTAPTLYILDEPTTGLHWHDVDHLLVVIQRLVKRGHTVVVIEHHTDVIRACDWLIDLGPEGGEAGGEIVGEGTPETISHLPTATGKALKSALEASKNPSSHQAESQKKSTTVSSMTIRGAKEHCLRSIDLDLPRCQWIAFCGPSGSGKSSMAFDILHAEGKRRYGSSLSPYARQFLRLPTRPQVDMVEGLSPPIAIGQKRHAGNPRSTIGTLTEIYDYLRVLFSLCGVAHCPETGERIQSIDTQYIANRVMAFPDKERIRILAPLSPKAGEKAASFFQRLQKEGFVRIWLDGREYPLDAPSIPYNPKHHHDLFLVIDRLQVCASMERRLLSSLDSAALRGEGTIAVVRESKELLSFHLAFAVESTGKSYSPLTPFSFSFNHAEGCCPLCQGWGMVTSANLLDSASPPSSLVCMKCKGERLSALARHVTIGEWSLGKLCLTPIEKALDALRSFANLGQKRRAVREVYDPLIRRLQFLCDLGLGYLSLHRSTMTLSSGEIQRVRLSRQLGSQLTGVLYILDEPTVGLHPKNIACLHSALRSLLALNNSLITIEHDPSTLQQADYLVDFGPGAGKRGGRVSAEGNYQTFLTSPDSLTAAYLSGEKTLAPPQKRRKGNGEFLAIRNAAVHHLSNISVQFPCGCFSCIVGVSGSGKSTLLYDVLYRGWQEFLSPLASDDASSFEITGWSAFDHVVALEQNPIGQNQRSNVGSYIDLLPALRQFYASLGLACAKGLKPGHFSTNHHSGMCKHCMGLGYRTVDRHFLPPVIIVCEQCNGLRLNPISLSVVYRDLNFGQLLQKSIAEVRALFSFLPQVQRTCEMMEKMGCGYLTLGQEVKTLSGGESQRLRLCRDFAKANKKRGLYLLDEPTMGLHPDDVRLLLTLFHQMVDAGHTLIVIEHNEAFIDHADYCVELGPGAGERGGQVVSQGFCLKKKSDRVKKDEHFCHR